MREMKEMKIKIQTNTHSHSFFYLFFLTPKRQAGERNEKEK